MRILELPQGYYTDLTGLPRVGVLEQFARDAAAFLEKFPGARPYHRPCWREFDVPDTTKRAPWGYEWYTVDDQGLLQSHSAQHDSSG